MSNKSLTLLVNFFPTPTPLPILHLTERYMSNWKYICVWYLGLSWLIKIIHLSAISIVDRGRLPTFNLLSICTIVIINIIFTFTILLLLIIIIIIIIIISVIIIIIISLLFFSLILYCYLTWIS